MELTPSSLRGLYGDRFTAAEEVMCLNILEPTKCSVIVVAVIRLLELSFYPAFNVLKSIYLTVNIH